MTTVRHIEKFIIPSLMAEWEQFKYLDLSTLEGDAKSLKANEKAHAMAALKNWRVRRQLVMRSHTECVHAVPLRSWQ